MKKRLAVLCLLPVFLFALAFSVAAEEVKDREITLDLSVGKRTGVYSGGWENNLPNGTGKFSSENDEGEKWYYEGEFVAGHFQGEGKCVWEIGQEMIGHFENDVLNGYGKKLMNGQLEYEGEWLNGSKSGNGTYYANGVVIKIDSKVSVNGGSPEVSATTPVVSAAAPTTSVTAPEPSGPNAYSVMIALIIAVAVIAIAIPVSIVLLRKSRGKGKKERRTDPPVSPAPAAPPQKRNLNIATEQGLAALPGVDVAAKPQPPPTAPVNPGRVVDI